MQNIHVKRYQTPGVWAGTVEPEDRSWIVFLASDGEASFWRRIEVTEPEGHIRHDYIPLSLV